MKKRYLLLCPLAACSIVLAGGVFMWNNAKPAPISLHTAYDRALVALGSQTNSFHCLRAEVTGDWSYGNAAWVFNFYSTNTPAEFKRVVVKFDGHTNIDPIIVQ